MQFKIHQRKSDKNNTEIYKKAVEFFVGELLPKSKRDKLKLTIIIKNFKTKEKTQMGYCSQLSRNSYKVEINKRQPFHSIISSIAHEIIHVKQGVIGKLTNKDEGFVWQGKMYKNVDIGEHNVYINTPWELEAYKLEPQLTEKFFKQVVIQEVRTLNE